jgi:hypothetical protein
LVVSDRTCPWLALEITTLAFGTLAPLASLTTPEIPATPPADCAKTGADTNRNSAAKYLNLIETLQKKIATERRPRVERLAKPFLHTIQRVYSSFCNNSIAFQLLFGC